MADDKERLKEAALELERKLQKSGLGDMEALKQEIVTEIRKESFKKEILDELGAKGFWKAAQQPAALLLIGFVLTTILGGAVTFLWQSKANAKQQERNAQQHDFEQKQTSQQRMIQQKYDLTNEVANAVAGTTTAAQDILDAWDRKNKRDYPERIKYWQVEGSRKWRVAYKILIPKLSSTFRDARINSIFQEIIDERDVLGNDIANLGEIQTRMGWKGMQGDQDVKEFKKDALDRTNHIQDKLVLLMKTMVDEIKVDGDPIVTPYGKTGLWNWLFS